jgi:hypothetical protein
MIEVKDIEFKIVQGKMPWELKPGEALEVTQEGRLGLILCCPACGKSASGTHQWDPDTQTLSPSIVHDVEGCGWHGYLRNGKFSNA